MSKNVSSADNQQERLLMQNIKPDYIVGLVDGEGYFSVTPRIRKYSTYQTVDIKMVFGMEVKESDGNILKEVQKYFRCGSIYRRTDKRERFCNLRIYKVHSHKDILNTIIPFFRRHPLRIKSKRNAFERFTIIGKMIVEREHLNSKGFQRIQRLAKKMHQ